MDYANMGDLICDKRKAKNMTQKDLADKLNVTDKAVSKWERGASYPDMITIPKLADILEISTDELLRFQTQSMSVNNCGTDIRQKINKIIDDALKGVGMAMGIATLVLSIMGKIETHTAITMLAIGLTSLGLSNLRRL